jgi:two-component system alkaline phosphatase synthesis response regulator PhoP
MPILTALASPSKIDYMRRAKILIVDDEPDLLDLLEYNLSNDGYEVLRAESGHEALDIVRKDKPELILLDIMMPDLDGVETCRRIRELPNGKDIYIMFLTARSEEFSELAGFDAGADDYVTKPVRPRVLLTRVKAILRRGMLADEQEADGPLLIADLRILKDEFLVYQNGKAINLPKKEFELLYFLAARPGKVFSREVLLKNIWGTDVFVVPRTIDVHIRKLREKLGEHYIQTVKGVGYKFVN